MSTTVVDSMYDAAVQYHLMSLQDEETKLSLRILEGKGM